MKQSQQPIASHGSDLYCLCLSATLNSSFMWRKTMNEYGWESLFRRGFHSFSLHQNTPSSWEWLSPALQHTLKQRSGWMTPKKKERVWGLGNDLRTEKEWGSYRSCPSFFCKVWDNTLNFLLVLCECWVCLWVRYLCMYVSVCQYVLYVFTRAVSPAVSL